MVVPGQLQSYDYALAVARAGGIPDAGRDRRHVADVVKHLLDAPERRTTLQSSTRGLSARWAGPADVLLGQVEHLIERAAHPAITLHLLPTGGAAEALAMVPFILYEFREPTSPTVVLVETQTADMYLSADQDVEAYDRLFDRLKGEALGPEGVGGVPGRPGGPDQGKFRHREGTAMTTPDWSKARWRKSINSDSGGCVEVAYADGLIGVRDTKDNGTGPILAFTEHEWDCFVRGVKSDEFQIETLAQ